MDRRSLSVGFYPGRRVANDTEERLLQDWAMTQNNLG